MNSSLTSRTVAALATLAVTLAATAGAARADQVAPAAAADAGPAPHRASPSIGASRVHLDLEVDPTAYVLGGYSLHAGVGWQRLRVDLGTYAMDVPAFLHGNDGWEAAFAGGGVKLQWFPFAAQRGAFMDVGVGVSRRTATLAATGATARAYATAIGASAGYRFWLPYGLYATPWAGLNVDLDDAAIMTGGQSFTSSRVTPFAALHVGYRFR